MNQAISTPARSTPMRRLSCQSHPSPSVACVGGMLRVVPESQLSNFHSPIQDTPPSAHKLETPQRAPQNAPHVPLTQKQVRELRRLCRKTANRAEFEDRLIQVRQIASIAAMGTPAAKFFDPHNLKSGAALRAWVDLHRELGADWRDERPLPDEAIDELRRWDRGLKAWARLRFETPQVEATTPARTAALGESPVPITPCTEKTSEEEHIPFSSPISPDVPQASSAQKHATLPMMPQVVKSPGVAVMETPVKMVDVVRRPMSEVSINRVGDTINVTVPSAMLSHSPGVDQGGDVGRLIARNDQENIYPSQGRKISYLHAANTAKSWRNNQMERRGIEQTLKETEREMVLRSAAKNLFASKDNNYNVSSAIGHQGSGRAEMDWGKLRRPALKIMSVNKAVNGQGQTLERMSGETTYDRM